MKAKNVSLAAVALFVVGGGLWFARSGSHRNSADESGVGVEMVMDGSSKDSRSNGEPMREHTLRPPDHMGRFRDSTPEKRVEYARKGSGPGG